MNPGCRVTCDVIVVGAGPVGLFLAARLAQRGVRPLVLERSEQRVRHSRAIGIHPPGLERLDDLGVARRIVEAGRRVMTGRAFSSRRCLGTLSFERLCPPPFNFVLTLQQDLTERILEERLAQLSPESLKRDCRSKRWPGTIPASG